MHDRHLSCALGCASRVPWQHNQRHRRHRDLHHRHHHTYVRHHLLLHRHRRHHHHHHHHHHHVVCRQCSFWFKQVRPSSDDPGTYISMGSVDPNKWYQCTLCGWWGRCDLYAPDRDALIDFDNGCRGLSFRCLWCDVDPTVWFQCTWCEWWGRCDLDAPDRDALTHSDNGIARWDEQDFSCLRCYVLDEPPWWPNNRDRCHMWIERLGLLAKLPQSVRRDVACYLAKNSK